MIKYSTKGHNPSTQEVQKGIHLVRMLSASCQKANLGSSPYISITKAFHRLGLFFESDSLSLSSEFPFSLFIAMDQTVVEGLLNLRLTKEEEEEISLKSRCKSDLLTKSQTI